MAQKERFELWAEVFRDIGLLLFVFGPLDTVLKEGKGTSDDWLLAGVIALVGICFMVAGVELEIE